MPMAKSNKLPILFFATLFILTILAYQLIISDKYYPLTFIGDTNVSFLTEGQAIRKLESKFNKRTALKLQFNSAQGSFTVDLATSSASLDYSSLGKAFKDQKQLPAPFLITRISPHISFPALPRQTDLIAEAVNKPYLDAQLTFDEIITPEGSPSARIQIKEGLNGLSLDQQKLEENLSQFILTGKYSDNLPIKVVPPKITTQYVLKARAVLNDTLQKPLKLTFNEHGWDLDTKQLLALLDLLQIAQAVVKIGLKVVA